MRASDWEEIERISNRVQAGLKKNNYQQAVDAFCLWAKDTLQLGTFSADPYFNQIFITWCILTSIPVYHWSILLEMAMNSYGIKKEL